MTITRSSLPNLTSRELCANKKKKEKSRGWIKINLTTFSEVKDAKENGTRTKKRGS